MVWVYLHSFSRCWLPKTPTNAKFRKNLNLQHFKVIHSHRFWYQAKAHMRLTISHFGPIFHHFWDTGYGDLFAENCVFFIPFSYLAPQLPTFPLEFRSEVNCEETRVMGLLSGESCVILTSTVFTDLPVWQTDRRTGDSLIACYSIYASLAVYTSQRLHAVTYTLKTAKITKGDIIHHHMA